jgi:hypothetical protein
MSLFFDEDTYIMETVLVQLTDQSAYGRLLELESLHLIKVLKSGEKPKKKLSEKFAGKLDISEDEYQRFQQYVKEARTEWDRCI